jgi:hypothetical protein
MFKRTASLGTVVFKGQRALVIEAIAKIPDPFARDQVVEAIDKAAYEKTFKKRKQVVTIPESVQYHLRELTKLGQLVEVASSIPVRKPNPKNVDLGPVMDGGMSRAAVTESSWATDESDADIRDMAREWYGYGRWDAPYWFIGPEPGQHGGNNIEGRRADLKKRCEAWIHLGRGELVDCKEHHLLFGEENWHRDAPRPRHQRTWMQLIRLFLAARDGNVPSLTDILSYQQKCWGTANGETCVIELSSLAATTLNAPGPHGLFREQRIEEIRQKIRHHRPKLVVMYGVRQKSHWEAIAGVAFSAAPDVRTLPDGATLAVFANHPVDSVGVNPRYWLQLANVLRQKLQSP